jgi:excisionase family DNA binding protein
VSGPLVVLPADELVTMIGDIVEAKLAALALAPKAEPSMLSTPELAEKLGCSRAKVHALAKAKKIRFRWLGDERRFVLADVLEDLAKAPAPTKTHAGPGRPRKGAGK